MNDIVIYVSEDDIERLTAQGSLDEFVIELDEIFARYGFKFHLVVEESESGLEPSLEPSQDSCDSGNDE